jgi:hypothetical protein
MSTASTVSLSQGGNTSTAGAMTTTSSTTTSKGSLCLYDLPHLENDGSNYAFWKIRTQAVLELQDLWDIVTGTIAQPDSSATADKKSNWAKKDREAHAQIILTLKDEPLSTVATSTSTKTHWEKLSVCYEGKGEQQIIHLIDEVFQGMLSDSKPLQPQINSLVRVAGTISALRLTLDDKLIVFAIILSLPSSMNTLKKILSNTKPSDMTTEHVTSQIVLDKQQHVHESGTSATVFFAKIAKKGRGRRDDKPGDKKKKCTHCKIRSHEASECQKLKHEKEEAAQLKGTTAAPAKPAASAKVAVADPSDNVVHVFTVFTAEPFPCDNKAFALGARSAQASQRWIVDSGASRSMSCNCKWFYSFTTLACPIRVTLGDNSAIPATGIGRIPVCMRANGCWSNAVLQDILFVPELNSNLLLVAHLTQCGTDVRFTGEGCQLYTQAGKLTCSGQLQGKLYIMDM